MSARASTDFVWHEDMLVRRRISAADDPSVAGDADPGSAVGPHGLSVVATEKFTSGGLAVEATYYGPASRDAVAGNLPRGVTAEDVGTALAAGGGDRESHFAVFPALRWSSVQVLQTFWPGRSVSAWTVTDFVAYSRNGKPIQPLHTARMGGDNWVSAFAVFSEEGPIQVSSAHLE